MRKKIGLIFGLMPKNAKSKKNSAKREVQEKRELLLKEQLPGTIYGQVTRALGDCNFLVMGEDGISRLCHLRKSIKRQFVLAEGIVLVGVRDFQIDKGDIVYVYLHEEATRMRQMGEIQFSLTSGVNGAESFEEKEDDSTFVFDEI